ncbi:unnamed protein product [Periconia digitata]|uniref:Uncharacterized protein n=1 Tax=Periconia digitata TaxID=1303443 RepID=A0A9W4U2I7_9PLEO|nr:unnamed protein product [Periconia digitata]
MAISRLQASLAAANSEVTFAAANINFDFTLVKYEAPKEYQVLGMSLSEKRKHNAEHGPSHITARKLGALFDGVCPAAPNLVAAYGTRASQIAETSLNQTEPYRDTIFSQYTGIDGTSIWAAATSSKSAIYVHLLACMLARMWTAQEAAAIWVELVYERRKEVAQKLEEGDMVNFALAAAAAQDISHSDLASLDGSARAWLRTADTVHQRDQKQLELILKNLKVPIGGDTKVFSNVILAWTTAIKIMDRLVAGVPQEVQNGAALLGLSAWHLFPDLNVFSPKIVFIKMKDPLMDRGGILSLGLSATPHSGNTEDNGVYWSLSLAHLKYYGPPVKSVRTVESDSRITFSQLNLVLHACLLRFWDLNAQQNLVVSDTICKLVEYLDKAQIPTTFYQTWFLQTLSNGVSDYLDPSPKDKDLKQKLIMLGNRRAKTFLRKAPRTTDSSEDDCLLGLLNYTALIECLKDHTSRVCLLRRIASRAQSRLKNKVQFIVNITPDQFGLDDEGRDDQNLVFFIHREIVDWKTSLCGNSDTTAMYMAGCSKEDFEITRELLLDIDLQLEDFHYFLERELIDPNRLMAAIFDKEENSPLWKPKGSPKQALLALSYAAQYYKDLSNATIDVGILTRPITETKWVRNIIANIQGVKWYRTGFSLIAYMETGIEIDPHDLRGVIAFSTADSIYVRSTIIQDPYKSMTERSRIRRILGNVGKPGITLMVPPAEMMIREIDAGSWRVACYNDFDGQPVESFQNTSTHLSFTEYQMKIYDGAQGMHDSQLSYIEPVFSVRDKGSWVADMNPSIFAGNDRFLSENRCDCDHPKNQPLEDDMGKVTVVDSWDELLDPPEGVFVIRTGGNWVARLALTMVAHHQLKKLGDDFQVIVCPNQACWKCVLHELAEARSPRQAIIF